MKLSVIQIAGAWVIGNVLLAALMACSSTSGGAAGPTVAATQPEAAVKIAVPAGGTGPNLVWTARGAGGGGAFFAPSFNPKNPEEMWVTSDMNPVLHTTNLPRPERSWETISWSQFSGGRDSHVRFTSDPRVLYALSGEKRTPIKSVDGGVSWKAMTGWKDEPAYCVLADLNSSKRILAAGKDNLYLSTDGGGSFASVYSSPGLYVGGAFFDSDGTIYVGCNKGLLKSTDNGAFAAEPVGLPGGDAIISFSGAKDSKGKIRLVCVASSASTKPGENIEALARGSKGVFSLDHGDKQWTARGTGIEPGAHIAFIGLASGNIDTIFAAGESSHGSPVVYKIADAGKDWTWTTVFQNAETGFSGNRNIYTGWEGDGGDRGYSFDELALDFTLDPGDANYAAITGDGFVHYTSDGGATWHQAYVSPGDENAPDKGTPKNKAYHNVGLNDTAVHWLAWADEKTLVAGYTDIQAARSVDGGKSWAIPDQTNLLNTQYKVELAPSGALYAASSAHHDMYQTWTRGDIKGAGNLIVSIDKGATWSIVHQFGSPVVWEQLDPNDPAGNIMYVSVVGKSGGIYKTSNLTAGIHSSWTQLAAPPRTEGYPYNIRILKDGTIVASYSDHNSPHFTPSSGVFVSGDGGESWIDRSDASMHYYTKDVVIDPTDPAQNTWYAAVHNGFAGYGEKVGGLYKTTNRGQSWNRVWELAGDGAESCTINPATGEIYLATESQGLMYAPDTKAQSPVFVATNYPYSHPYRVFISPYDSKQVWVVSYGNGIAEGMLPAK